MDVIKSTIKTKIFIDFNIFIPKTEVKLRLHSHNNITNTNVCLLSESKEGKVSWFISDRSSTSGSRRQQHNLTFTFQSETPHKQDNKGLSNERVSPENIQEITAAPSCLETFPSMPFSDAGINKVQKIAIVALISVDL